MKIQVRKSLFETNSSSTHAICIPKKDEEFVIPKMVTFHFRANEFTMLEAEMSTMQDRADFLYTLLTMMPYSCFIVDRFYKILSAHKIIPIFEDPEEIPEPYWNYDTDYAYFVHTLLADSNKLLRFLFSKDTVSIYTDRDYEPNMDRIHALEESDKYDMFMRYDL